MVCFLLLFSGCALGGVKSVDLNKEFKLTKGQTAHVVGTNLDVEFVEFIDSYKNLKQNAGKSLNLGLNLGGPLPVYFKFLINGKEFRSRQSWFGDTIVGDYRIWTDYEESNEDGVTSIIYKNTKCDEIENQQALVGCLINSNDLTGCLKIKESEYRQSCKESVLENMDSIVTNTQIDIKKMCADVGDSSEVGWCMNRYFVSMAKHTLDYTLCGKMIVDGKKTYSAGCYGSLAVLLNDGKICDLIVEKNDQLTKDDCYLNVAPATGDKKWCTKIIDSDYKKACEGRF